MDALPRTEPLRVRRMPLLLAAGCFAAGILLAHGRWHSPFALFWSATGLLALTAWAQQRAARIAWMPLLALWSAVGCWCAQVQPPIERQTALLPFADGLSRTVRGTVLQVRPLTVRTPEAGQPDARTPDTHTPDAFPQAAQPWLAEPGAWEPEGSAPRTAVDLQVSAVEEITPDVSTMQPVTGGVRLTLSEAAASTLRCGDTVEVPLRLRPPETYRDPGAWSSADGLLEEGMGAIGRAGTDSHPARLVITGHTQAGWSCRLHAAQAWAGGRLDALVRSPGEQRLPHAVRLTTEDAALLAAMLFGDRHRLTRTLRTGFERTGTFHLFVVSGLHIALLAGGLLWLLRRLRMPYPAAALLSLTAAAAYAVLTGWGLPVQRALGMTAAYLLARLLARTTGPLNALGAAALAVLALSPRALYTASFQMTFLVIFALGGLATPLAERSVGRLHSLWHELAVLRRDASLPPRIAEVRVHLRLWGELLAALVAPASQAGSTWRMRIAGALPASLLRLLSAAGTLLLGGVVAECCMVLPMAVYFHRATLLALPANLLCLPLIGLLLCAAMLCFAAALLGAKWALLPALLTAALLHGLRTVVEHLARLPAADLRVPAPVPAALLSAALLLLAALWALRAPRRAGMAAGVAALLLVPLLTLWPAQPLLHPGTLEVTALDVGQGDALLVVSPAGRTLLVDAGGPVGQADAGPEPRWDIGEEVVAPYLWTRRIRRLDAVMLTHAHSDHMGGMPAILRDLRPRELWLSVQPGRSPGLLALQAEAAQLGIAIRWFHAGDAFAWGGLQAGVLAPELSYANPGAAVNDDSLVLRLAFGQASVLLEGDAEARSEAAMLANGRVVPSTLLKVGHHGSKTSTTAPFLAAVAPRDAVVSVGSHNTFGHPRRDVLQRLQDAGIKTFRTDRGGLATFLLRPDGSITAMAGSDAAAPQR